MEIIVTKIAGNKYFQELLRINEFQLRILRLIPLPEFLLIMFHLSFFFIKWVLRHLQHKKKSHLSCTIGEMLILIG